MSENNQSTADSRGAVFRFRWSYIILPVGFLALTVILVLAFYSNLSDQLAYRFGSDGSPKSLAGRGTLVLWLLVIQIVFTLGAVVVVKGVNSLANRYVEPGEPALKSQKIILFMGNIIAMPQSIFCFAMVDIFIYNLNGTHLIQVWLFALIVMILVGILLGIFMIRMVRVALKSNKE